MQLLPRYRRILAFADVLDESIRLFRQHWITFALVSAVSLFPPGLLVIWMTASGFLTRSLGLADLGRGNLDAANLAQFGGVIFASTVISGLFGLLWAGATIATAEALLRGEEPSLARVYALALRRLFVVLVSTVVFVLALVLLSIPAALTLAITLGGLLLLLPTVLLIVWWVRPGARKGWLKWLIILSAPFGLVMYYSFRWSLYLTAVIVEHAGPIAALQRSSQLTDRQWFRVAGVLLVASLIVAILRSLLTALVDLPLAIGGALRGQSGLSPVEATISAGASVLLQILFASVGSIVYTLLFVDLRNRREGTDMAERLTQLEASSIAPDG